MRPGPVVGPVLVYEILVSFQCHVSDLLTSAPIPHMAVLTGPLSWDTEASQQKSSAGSCEGGASWGVRAGNAGGCPSKIVGKGGREKGRRKDGRVGKGREGRLEGGRAGL